ncbi:MAG: ABC-type transport auxiliary lipoprotein family protein [Nitrospiraceae bacterium]|nr:ABC-type transport auxiliary lipoprotein family protein [Nitrospiraceae bacterium]
MRIRQDGKSSRRLVRLPWVAPLAFLVLSGCVSLAKSFPDKQYYALEVIRHGEPGVPATGAVLDVRGLLVSPRFEGKELVYRTGDTRYESDFYSAWFVSPSAMLTQQVRDWLTRARLFEHVVSTSSYLDATHILEGTMTALYGDYRQQGEHKAVVGMHLVLIEDTSPRTTIVFQHDYQQMVELSETTPDALTRGWNQGLEQIFMALEADLRRVNLKANNQKPASQQ